MKLRNLFAGMILCLAVASCIQDEAQNVEAAIDGCSGNHIQQYLIDRNDFTVQLIRENRGVLTVEICLESMADRLVQ